MFRTGNKRQENIGVFSLCQYFLSCLHKYERRNLFCNVISRCRDRRRVSGTRAGRVPLTAALRGDVSLPPLVRVLSKARNWEKTESWDQTAAPWKKTQPCTMVFVLLEMQVKNQHVSTPPQKKISRQIFLSDRLILFSAFFLSKYINFVYKLCYSK